MKASKCKKCNNPAWSGGLCKNHIPRKAMVSLVDKIRPYARSQNYKNFDKKEKTRLMHTFFMEIWDKRPHKSEIDGERLFGEPSSAYFHHILPKNKYEEAAFDEENIILMTIDQHNNVENDMYKFEEVNKRRKVLLTKYNLI